MNVREIYQLRKSGSKDEAHRLAKSLYFSSPESDEIKLLYCWTLYDMCKKYMKLNDKSSLQINFSELQKLAISKGDLSDVLSERVHDMKSYISNPHYELIARADEMSKSNKHIEALNLMMPLFQSNELFKENHEKFGWILYRYLKSRVEDLGNLEDTSQSQELSLDIRRHLSYYIKLEHEKKDSLLHRSILWLMVKHFNRIEGFNFFRFLTLWDLSNLTDKDCYVLNYDNKYPLLAKSLCSNIFNSNIEYDLDFFIDNIPAEEHTVIDYFREAYHWRLYNLHEENRFDDLWKQFSDYNKKFQKYKSSCWHSKILSLAYSYMKEDKMMSKFIAFFREWNPDKLLEWDWRETTENGSTYPALALTIIKKCFEFCKANKGADSGWLIPLFDKGTALYPNDVWLLRNRAILYIWNRELDKALDLYKKIILELGSQVYIWSEVSQCVTDNLEVKIGLLALGLQLHGDQKQRNNLRISLVELLLSAGLLENALIELDIYKNEGGNSWKYDALYKKLGKVNPSITNNSELYKKTIPQAQNIIYSDFEWTNLVLVEKWNSKANDKFLTFSDGKEINFVVKEKDLISYSEYSVGKVYATKLHKIVDKVEDSKEGAINRYFKKKPVNRYVPVMIKDAGVEDWIILPEDYGYIHSINYDSKTIHIVSGKSGRFYHKYVECDFKPGDFVRFNIYNTSDKDHKLTCRVANITKCELEQAISHFALALAVVDGVNEKKQLFHCVVQHYHYDELYEDEIWNILQEWETCWLSCVVYYDKTSIRPNVGDFLNVRYTVNNKSDKCNIVYSEYSSMSSSEMRKKVEGILDVHNDENGEIKFAILDNCYVPKSLLNKYKIKADSKVSGLAVFKGLELIDKKELWEVYELDLDDQ